MSASLVYRICRLAHLHALPGRICRSGDDVAHQLLLSAGALQVARVTPELATCVNAWAGPCRLWPTGTSTRIHTTHAKTYGKHMQSCTHSVHACARFAIVKCRTVDSGQIGSAHPGIDAVIDSAVRLIHAPRALT